MEFRGEGGGGRGFSFVQLMLKALQGLVLFAKNYECLLKQFT